VGQRLNKEGNANGVLHTKGDEMKRANTGILVIAGI